VKAIEGDAIAHRQVLQKETIMKLINKVLKAIAVLKLPKPPQAVSAQAKAILAALGNNPSIFVTPVPPLATFKADIDALDSAETQALTKAKGAVEARNAKLAVVVEHVHDARAYVNKIANADPPNAAAIITAGGFSIKKSSTRSKQLLAAKQGASTGIVVLTAKAVATRAAYEWEWSLDQKSWTDVPLTTVAHTSISGLSPAVIHYFRFRASTSKGRGDWSEVVTLIVH
jgi:hypothetical protein